MVESYSKTLNTFDEQGNMILSTTEEWIDEQWIPNSKEEKEYNDYNQIVQALIFYWNTAQDDWEIIERQEYTYNIMGYLASHKWYQNELLSQTEESIYDEYGNLTEFIESYYPEGSSYKYKTVYTYDNGYTYEDLLLPVFAVNPEFSDLDLPDLNSIFKHKLTNIQYFENEGLSWKQLENSTLYYSEQKITGIDDISSIDKVSLFPNPTAQSITFQLTEGSEQFQVQLFDMQGKEVFYQLIQNNKPISIEFLNDGLYLYRLIGNGRHHTGKFQIIR